MKKSLLCSLLLLSLPVVGFAQTNSTTFQATTSVAANCTIATTQNIMFGTFDPVGLHASAGPTGQGQVTVSCTKGNYGIVVSDGLNSQSYTASQTATYPAGWYKFEYSCGRRMAGPSSSFIRYELYTDAAMTARSERSEPRDGTSASPIACSSMTVPTFRSVAFTSPGAQLVNLYAKIPVSAATATARPGTYTDTLSVTINF